jgi:hypothetical protein
MHDEIIVTESQQFVNEVEDLPKVIYDVFAPYFPLQSGFNSIL